MNIRDSFNGHTAKHPSVYVATITLVLIINLLFTLVIIQKGNNTITGKLPADFNIYYITSYRFLNDLEIYNKLTVPSDLSDVLSDVIPASYLASPPFLVLLTSPLIFLPFEIAWWSLTVFSWLIVFLSTFVTARTCQFSRKNSWLIASWAVTSLPVFILLIANHFESVLLLLALFGLFSIKKKYNILVGLFLGASTAFKLFPLYWFLPFCNRRYLKIFSYSMASFIVINLFTLYLIGFDQLYLFLNNALPQSMFWYKSPGNLSLLTIGTVLCSTTAGWVLSGLGAILIAYFLFRRTLPPDQFFIIAISGSLLLSPLSWSYYYILLIPCLIILASHLESTKSNRLQLLFLIISLCFWPSLLGSLSDPIIMALPAPIDNIFRFLPTLGLSMLIATTFQADFSKLDQLSSSIQNQ